MIKFGLKTNQAGVSFEGLKKLWLEAEAAGFDSAWLMDHMYGRRAEALSPNEDVLECWTTLSALAASTSRIRMGALILCNPLRHAPLLAKMGASLDVISQGRLNLALGAGDWLEEEYRSYGISYPPEIRKRIEQLEESIRIIRMMWTEDEATFRGKYYAIEKAICKPKPVQKPHPPIWIGIWTGKKVMPRLAGTLADAVNLTQTPPLACAEKLQLIEEFARKAGNSNRPLIKSWQGYVTLAATEKELDQIVNNAARTQKMTKEQLLNEQNVKGSIIGTPEKFVKTLREYIAVGINYFVLNFQTTNKIDAIRLFSKEVMPAIADLPDQ